MTKETKITKRQAVRFIDDVFDVAFGCEKGSGEAWEEFCATKGLCESWDGDEELTEAHRPPGQYDILIAAGISPDELIEFLGINPALFK